MTGKVLGLALGILLIGSAMAEENSISAAEAFEAASDPERQVLFVDVRDPIEIMFIGWTDVVDINIPFLLVQRDAWNDERGSFPMPRNPRFAEQVGAALESLGMGRNATIITMCRSGSARGGASAEALREAGFPNVFYVRHGFQGDRLSEGEQAGMRLKNGWQNEGLPWQPRFNPDKIYRPES
ncbi:MAG: rhodanese-like domain-containing protein [Wenzhouxiangella sp.]|jgi:rhodanese-related sulfurtransferase|nr:rhodanese-like domain-containing protein [Wenzhouxiangella sp.]